jgi:hypothetical protein
LIRNVDARNASSQYFNGMCACVRRDNPTSTMCLCFLSAAPFY